MVIQTEIAVKKGVMDGFPIFKRYNPKHTRFRFVAQMRYAPMPDATVGLNGLPNRSSDDPRANFKAEIRPLAQHLLLKIARDRHPSPCPKRIGDWIAAVATEVAGAEFDAGRSLAALIFGDTQQPFDPRDDIAVKPARGDFINR